MGHIKDTETRTEASPMPEGMQTELDRQLFHLKTLYDVSRELLGIVEVKAILKNFLLMTMGNFGVVEGFVFTQDAQAKETTQLVSMGFQESDRPLLVKGATQFLAKADPGGVLIRDEALQSFDFLLPAVVCTVPFSIDEGCSGFLGLGSKIVGDPYSNDDKDLLETLVNSLVVSLKNARSFEDIKRLNLDMQEKNVELEKALNELDRRVYHLKTLYDVSKDIFGSVDFETILKNFLLMAMGNFGVIQAFILTLDTPSGEITHFESNGYQESDFASLREGAQQLLLDGSAGRAFENAEVLTESHDLIPSVDCGVSFRVDEKCMGFLGLGSKLIGEPYNEDDRELLVTLVNNLVVALKNAISFENIKRQLALDHELEKGRQIQRNFLPDQIPQLPNWEIATCFFPALQVSGDFYDAFLLPGECVGLVIADVCDKGVGSALFMALSRSLIRVFSGESSLHDLPTSAINEKMQAATDAHQINALKAVALTNDYIAQEHGEEGMFATVFFGVLDPKTGLLAYINAGHVPPFIVGSAGVKQRLKPTGPAVGMMPHMKFSIQEVQLEPGDILLGYTDGVTEAQDPSGEFYTINRLLSLLDQPASTASDLLERIKEKLFIHMDKAEQFDDITMIAVHREERGLDI